MQDEPRGPFMRASSLQRGEQSDKGSKKLSHGLASPLTQTMKTETTQRLALAFRDSVRAHVKAGGNVRWGEAESNGVISDMVGTLLSDEDAILEGPDAIAPFVAKVVNPSAFAQFLEKLPASGFGPDGEPLAGAAYGHPARIVRPARGSGGARSALAV